MQSATVVPVRLIEPPPDATISMEITPAEIKLRALGRLERAIGDALADALNGRYVACDDDAVYEPTDAEFVIADAPLDEPFAITVRLGIEVKPVLRSRLEAAGRRQDTRRAMDAESLLAGADFLDPFSDY